MDFLLEHRAIINIPSAMVTFDGGLIQTHLMDTRKSNDCWVRTVNSVLIPPLSEAELQVKIGKQFKQQIGLNMESISGIAVARALQQRRTVARWVNPTNAAVCCGGDA